MGKAIPDAEGAVVDVKARTVTGNDKRLMMSPWRILKTSRFEIGHGPMPAAIGPKAAIIATETFVRFRLLFTNGHFTSLAQRPTT